MSRSILKVASRAVNADVQNHNNVTTFLQPIGHRGYGFYGPPGPIGPTGPGINVTDPSNGKFLISDGTPGGASASGLIQYYDDYNLLTIGSYIGTDIMLGNDNGSIVASKDILVNDGGNQVVNMSMFSASDISQPEVTTVNSTNLTTVVTYNYTPKSYSTKLYIEYYTTYMVGGNSTSQTDSFESQIYIVTDASGPIDVQIGKGFQQWLSC